MVPLRSRRLEGIFGARLDAVSHAQVASLVTNAVTEASDLDFKKELYGASDRAKRDLAGDVAALANTSGGVLVLGIEEDDQARAKAAPGVAVSDAEVRRVEQIVADTVYPTPTINVWQVEDPQQEGHGFLLIAVPPSPMAPHAVQVDKGLRYPRRYGTTTTYLTETQVSAAYRERFAAIQGRYNDLARYEGDLVDRLDGRYLTSVVVTLVPDLSGDFALDAKAMRQLQEELVGKDPRIVPRGSYYERVTVGSRRLIAYAGSSAVAATYLACELHKSGAGVYAAAVTDRRANGPGTRVPESDDVSRIDDEDIVLDIWSGLRFLARHARDRAAAGGNATVRVTLWPVSHRFPAELHHPRSYGGVLGAHQALSPPVATDVFDIDDLAEDGPALVAAAAGLATDLIQYFGYPEVLQMTNDGRIRTKYWSRERYGPQVMAWAATAGVELTDETVT
ncbi:AlbA family DNA-binding domain-containing protein [Actinacidiphila oryziradicis]|uniref:ATP-binding protein n=1 Tax=Actinacidiphila oryziradicis TaxID=2571141 RepID=A0A4V5MXJ7_9ACTN|nr:ATP-binding protein [Actinacidiphila oryziradicis]TJZ95308.1 ATP-binding protein [Actinacidiphila oryziradicis]